MKVGDVVQLKSGGPVMTVTRIASDGDSAEVTWFDKEDHVATKFIENDALKSVHPRGDTRSL